MWTNNHKKDLKKRMSELMKDKGGYSVIEEDNLLTEFNKICGMKDDKTRDQKESDFQNKLITMENNLKDANQRKKKR